MILRCTSFEQMREEIFSRNLSVVLFGAGAIGAVVVPEIMEEYGLMNRVIFYVDNALGGKNINIQGRSIEVKSVEYLKSVESHIAIVVTVSRYVEVLKQLENMERVNQLYCYIFPMMCIQNFCATKSKGIPFLVDGPMIPKKIHYIWFGKTQIPNGLQKCIDSWKIYCPDYDIIRWDESNYDVSKNTYMQEAYQAKAYSFVSDYARLDILYQHGGIYFDTDVELIKNIDSLLCQEAFCSVEKWQILNSGGGIGAIPKNQMILELLRNREEIKFLDVDGRFNKVSNGFYETKAALKNGYKITGETQNIRGMNIYAFDYFHPYDYMSGQMFITDNTYSIHHFNGGWLDDEMKQANLKVKKGYNCILKKCLVTVNK